MSLFHDLRFTTGTVMKPSDNCVETASFNPQATSLLPGKEKIQQEVSASSQAFILHLTSYGMMPRQFNLGMVVHSEFRENRLVSALAKPGSACSLSDFVVLDHPSPNEATDVESSLRKSILKDHQATKIRLGEAGFEELLKSNVDAIYIYVPAE